MPSLRRTLLELVLLGLLAALLAYGVSASLRIASLAPPPPADAPAIRTTAPPPPLDAYAPIAARDVFNAARPDDGTPLAGLRLLGVGLHGDAAEAVIEDGAGGEQRLHRVGDHLRGARLAAISWDRATLTRGGSETVLELVKTSDPAPADVPRESGPPPPPSPSVRRTGTDAWIVDRRALAGAVDDMSGLMTQLRAVAEVEDGRPAGFRLFQIADESIFRRLGLENGDVVQRVNGRAVADPASLLGFLQRLRTEPRVALDIVRGGATRTLVYDLR